MARCGHQLGRAASWMSPSYLTCRLGGVGVHSFRSKSQEEYSPNQLPLPLPQGPLCLGCTRWAVCLCPLLNHPSEGHSSFQGSCLCFLFHLVLLLPMVLVTINNIYFLLHGWMGLGHTSQSDTTLFHHRLPHCCVVLSDFTEELEAIKEVIL